MGASPVTRALVFALAVMLAGCATAPRGTFCDVAKPMRPTSTEISSMSEASVAAALEHNRKGEKLCGWRP